MEFEYSVSNENGILNVYLKGFLDASNAVGLMEEMKKYVGISVTRIVFHAKELEYIASSGLRVIIYTKQKIGYEAEVILKEPQAAVISVFEMSGLINFVTIE